MKNKPDLAATAEAERVAALKVAKVSRIAEADDRLARAAKTRFKDAKKTWKLARKVAKRSAKRAKLAEKNLAALQKYLKRSRKKAGSKPVSRKQPAIRKRSAKSRANRAAGLRPAAPVGLADNTPPGSGGPGAV